MHNLAVNRIHRWYKKQPPHFKFQQVFSPRPRFISYQWERASNVVQSGCGCCESLYASFSRAFGPLGDICEPNKTVIVWVRYWPFQYPTNVTATKTSRNRVIMSYSELSEYNTSGQAENKKWLPAISNILILWSLSLWKASSLWTGFHWQANTQTPTQKDVFLHF